MASNFVEWYLQLWNARLDQPINDDTGIYNVLTADDPAELTIYSDAQGSSQANPGTMTDGVIRFWTASTTTSCDISVLTAAGQSFFLEGVTQSNHKIVVNPDASEYTMVVPYAAVGASVSVDTGFTGPANGIVREVWLKATTLGTGFLIDVGTTTDPNGFIVEQTVATTGYKVMGDTLTSISVSGSVGALLVAATATNGGNHLGYVRANQTSGASIVYTNVTVSSAAGGGYIFLRYTRMPV